MCDIDLLQLYNDRYGHQDGELCLKKVDKALDEVTKSPKSATRGRYGGAELIRLHAYKSE